MIGYSVQSMGRPSAAAAACTAYEDLPGQMGTGFSPTTEQEVVSIDLINKCRQKIESLIRELKGITGDWPFFNNLVKRWENGEDFRKMKFSMEGKNKGFIEAISMQTRQKYAHTQPKHAKRIYLAIFRLAKEIIKTERELVTTLILLKEQQRSPGQLTLHPQRDRLVIFTNCSPVCSPVVAKKYYEYFPRECPKPKNTNPEPLDDNDDDGAQSLCDEPMIEEELQEDDDEGQEEQERENDDNEKDRQQEREVVQELARQHEELARQQEELEEQQKRDVLLGLARQQEEQHWQQRENIIQKSKQEQQAQHKIKVDSCWCDNCPIQ